MNALEELKALLALLAMTGLGLSWAWAVVRLLEWMR